ncbi:carboxypeptidase-like regulatory domain-containing protein [Pedobacter panaciterrae]
MKLNQYETVFTIPLLKFSVNFSATLTILFLLLTCLQVSAKPVQRITISKKNSPIVQIFEAIKQQSGYSVVYNSDDLKERNVSLNVKNSTVEETMEESLKDSPFAFKILNKNILIKKKDEPSVFSPSTTKPQAKEIKGKVVDKQNISIPGVSIKLKGTSIGTVTNGEGLYAISIPENTGTLVFSMVGYTTKEVTIGSDQTINVILLEETSALNEVVVIGYGTQKNQTLLPPYHLCQQKA